MIPIRDENPTLTYPLVTVFLIAVNVIVFLYEAILPPQQAWLFVNRFGAIPAALTHFTDPFPYDGVPVALTLVTSMFLHGGLLHVAGNMLFLWIFGNNIEDALGHARFVFFYLACGLAAALLHIAFNPGSRLPMVGASGAIAGIMGGYLILFPRAQVLTMILIVFYPLFVWVPAVFFLVFWFLLQFLYASAGASGNVAWVAHVGGFLTGIFLVRILLSRRGKGVGWVPRGRGRSPYRPFIHRPGRDGGIFRLR
jgi:membrane associated rhomboid family serine protease